MIAYIQTKSFMPLLNN